ncbi:matrix metalloproteinase-21-like isoform X5 [Engystomops pustulosus]|uniref:matrix metalloproteinase-21-like isoform X5 n=1 Tax=Engystomops pustulosus TaxID=76066 RepID=UPI003AFB5EAD
MASLRRVGTWSGDSKNKMLFQDKVLQTHWLNTSVHPLWHYCKRRSPDVQRYTHRENLRSSQLGAKTDTADSELKNTEKFENMDSTALVTLLLINLGTGDTIYQAPKPSDIKSQPRDNAEADLTKTYAQTYLWKYGWIEPVRWDSLPFRGVASRSKENPVNADISSLLSEGEPLSSIQDIPKHPDPTLNPRFIAALKRFQEANRLRVTGMLDDATRDAMNAPRCGVPDRKIPEVEKSEEVNPTESGISTSDPQHSDPAQITTTVPSITSASQRIRRELMEKKKSSQPQVGSNLGLGRHVRKKRGEPLKAGNKKGIFSKMTIKWRLLGEGYSVWLNIDQQRSILMRAFRIWSEVVPLNFEEDVTSPAHLIDIKLGFGTGRHLGCSQLFDGMGREFAHAWRLGDIHFDDDEHFVPPNSEQGISLLKGAVPGGSARYLTGCTGTIVHPVTGFSRHISFERAGTGCMRTAATALATETPVCWPTAGGGSRPPTSMPLCTSGLGRRTSLCSLKAPSTGATTMRMTGPISKTLRATSTHASSLKASQASVDPSTLLSMTGRRGMFSSFEDKMASMSGGWLEIEVVRTICPTIPSCHEFL